MSGAPVALVTGGGRGLGRAIALALGEAGLAVGILARSGSDLAATRAELERRGTRACACVADVADLGGVVRAVRLVEEELSAAIVRIGGARQVVTPDS